jgi:hypothetical protein
MRYVNNQVENIYLFTVNIYSPGDVGHGVLDNMRSVYGPGLSAYINALSASGVLTISFSEAIAIPS